jgi:hypothetical protein
MRIRIDHAEFRGQNGICEIEVSAEDCADAAFIPLPEVEVPALRNLIDRLRSNGVWLMVPDDFFSRSEDEQRLALLEALRRATN